MLAVHTDDGFHETLKAHRVVVVKYSATWCRKCKKVAPVFEKLAKEFAGVAFISVDTTELEQLALAQGVSALPTAHVFQDGESCAIVQESNPSKCEAGLRAALDAAGAEPGTGAPATGAEDVRPVVGAADGAAPVGGRPLSLGLPAVAVPGLAVLQAAADAGALNVATAAGGAAVQVPVPTGDALAVAQHLQTRVLELVSAFVAEDGSAVDYAAMRSSEMFRAYARDTLLLQALDLGQLAPEERKAFALNLYNALTMHGTVVRGPPGENLSTFFGGTAYLVGPHVLSLDDLEHGVLRGNQVHPTTGKRFFAEDDPRAALALPLDPRVHCALVCGAKSCPPVRVFKTASLDASLEAAARAFCGSEIAVDEAGARVSLSRIFLWYGADFGATIPAQLHALAAFLPEADRAALGRLADRRAADEASVEVEYRAYDWGANAR